MLSFIPISFRQRSQTMPTVLHRLARWADATPDAPAQKYKKGKEWHAITARELRDRIYHLALFLEARGITSADTGAILAPNSPQWVQIDLATTLLGAKSAGMYPNSVSKDILYVLNHTEAKLV